MSFTIDPTVPADSESPRLGAQRIRDITAELLQVLGFTGLTSETIAAAPGVQIDTATGLLLVGSIPGAINLRGDPDGVAPTTTIDITADIVYMLNPSTFNVTRTTAFTANNLVVGAQAGTILNGRDQAAAFGNNTFFHLYAIGGGGQTPGTLTSLTAPLTGPTLPASYTSWAYLGTFLTDGSGNVLPMRLRGNTLYYQANQIVLNAGTATSSTNVPISTFVPSIATQFELFIQTNSTAASAASAVFCYIGQVAGALNATTAFFQVKFFAAGGGGGISTWTEMPFISGGYYYKLDAVATGATLSTSHQIQGYRVPNGST